MLHLHWRAGFFTLPAIFWSMLKWTHGLCDHWVQEKKKNQELLSGKLPPQQQQAEFSHTLKVKFTVAFIADYRISIKMDQIYMWCKLGSLVRPNQQQNSQQTKDVFSPLQHHLADCFGFQQRKEKSLFQGFSSFLRARSDCQKTSEDYLPK